MRLLLISNSTNPGEAYLDYPKKNISEFIGPRPVKVLFIPYAAITFSYDEYERKVKERFIEIGHDLVSIHHFKDPVSAVKGASIIVTGGGNTWMLLRLLQENHLIDPVREKVLSGTPYIGWSAGSNVACPTIMTTNDMPVVEPDSFQAFDLIPFQINPHYLDSNPSGHSGETREQRIEEFINVNPGVYVTGLREGTMLLIKDGNITLAGRSKARIFKRYETPRELGVGDDLSFLLK
jgi:dipeptidase E